MEEYAREKMEVHLNEKSFTVTEQFTDDNACTTKHMVGNCIKVNSFSFELFQMFVICNEVQDHAVSHYVNGTMIPMHVTASLSCMVAVKGMEIVSQQSRSVKQNVSTMTQFCQRAIAPIKQIQVRTHNLSVPMLLFSIFLR